jgi:DNA invertase Pin-like site-specific DNA recombinase
MTGGGKMLENQTLKNNEKKVRRFVEEGKSYGEIAKYFKVPKTTVKRFCNRRGLESIYAKNKNNFLRRFIKWLKE